jgi:cell fate (sporulation/competence/biofilm development) regulator YmcA (YheA/YmcA/DUF963 family)
MSFDTSNITSSNPKLQFKDTGLEFDDAAGALKAAKARDGDEVVVGYVTESGEMKFALVDARTEGSQSKQVAHFDPNQVGFADGAHVVSAFTVDDRSDFDYVKIVPPATGGDAIEQADGALSLARAATQKDEGAGGFIRSSTPGFRYEHSNTDWGAMVRSNKVTVLDHIETTLKGLDTKQADLLTKLDAARKSGNTGEAASLEKQLARISEQRSELATHQTTLQAELLVDAETKAVTVPGTDDGKGKELTVGLYRNPKVFHRAQAMLHDALAQVESTLAATTDPVAKAGLEKQAASLKMTIKQLEQVKAGIIEATMHQGYRDMALAQIGGALSVANSDLATRQKNLGDLQRQADAIQKSDKPYAVRSSELAALQTKIEAERKAIDAGLDQLISTMESQIDVYAKHSGSGATPQAAVALLKNEVAQLKALKASGGGLDLAALARQVSGAIDVIQTEHDKLIEIVSKGAKKWDGISPKEGLELLRIDADVKTYKTAYKEAKAMVDLATSKSAIPPENHVLDIEVGKDYTGQGDWNSCGTTSLAMTLSYLSKYYPIDAKAKDVLTIDAAIRPNSRGEGVIDSFTAPNDIQDYVEDLGMKAVQTNDASTDDLKKMIDQGIPPIILTDYERSGTPNGESLHYVVVKGYVTKPDGTTEWKIENPWGQTDTLSSEELMKVWSNLHLHVPVAGAVSSGYNRLMITVVPPSGVIKDGNGDKHPAESIQTPPYRKPALTSTAVEWVNKGAHVINKGAEYAHDIKEGVEDAYDYTKEKVGDAIDYVIDNPLSIVTGPIGLIDL